MKNLFTLMVACMLSAPAFAVDFNGKVGLSSDNYFRGVNMSDGAGYTVSGSLSLDNGIFAGAKVMSMNETSDLMTTTMIGYGKDVSGVLVHVAYIDRGFEGVSLNGWEEVAVKAHFDKFEVQYSKGLDNAGDTYIVSSSALPLVDVAYGDSDMSGTWYEVSKTMDVAKGNLKVGYIDHESNDDDFSDKITDVDNFYVGYSYSF